MTKTFIGACSKNDKMFYNSFKNKVYRVEQTDTHKHTFDNCAVNVLISWSRNTVLTWIQFKFNGASTLHCKNGNENTVNVLLYYII